MKFNWKAALTVLGVCVIAIALGALWAFAVLSWGPTAWWIGMVIMMAALFTVVGFAYRDDDE